METVATDFDAYKLLQVDPQADDIVVEAAFRALARRYHPDNHGGDSQRMADINKAYDLLRTPVRRRRYDRDRHLTPVGPGTSSVEPPPTNGAVAKSPGYAGVNSQRQQPSQSVIDFGRYRGWALKDLAKHDPDYLRWLARSSGGVRYRNLIQQLLPEKSEPVPTKLTPRHRG
ncbi:MAG: DnaJ domain-containing protein [Candidatus Limnocylindria bacterium]